MPREKINFDKKKLFQLFDKSTIGLIEKGILMDISRFLFNPVHYHILFDVSTGTLLTKDMLIDYLSKLLPGMGPEQMVDSMIRKGILDINNENHVYVPLLFHQHVASNNKKRAPLRPKVPISIPVSEKDTFKSQGAQMIMPIDENPQQDLKLHLQGEQQQSRKVKESARAILDHLNDKTQKPKGFGPTTGNLMPIISRLKEGFTQEECCQMIDFKYHQWKDTPKESFLKPSTLFRPSNFEGYLNEALTYYKNQQSDQKHKLNDYINKWFARVAKLPLQMSFDQCEKIMTQCPDFETVKKCLMFMENDPKLMDYNNSVYLTLKTRLGRVQVKNGKTGPTKSAAK